MVRQDFVQQGIYAFITLLLFFIFFSQLGTYPFLDNNEGLYALIPLEMLQSKNWVIPTLNGVPYIEKPPLLYWLIAVSYKVFGVSEWSARLVTCISGLLICFSVSRFARRTRFEESEWIAPLILGTSLGFIVFSRMVYFDVLFSLLLSLSLFYFYYWYQNGKKRYSVASYVALALATLTKGLLAPVLAGIVIFVFLILDRAHWKTFFSFIFNRGLFVYFLIVTPWHLMAQKIDPNFAWFYFVNEHFNRFLDLREPKDYYRGPFYYYLPRLFLYVFPWSLHLFFLTRAASPRGDAKVTKFLWVWFLSFLIFFSISKAKANYYMVAALPPLVLLISNRIEDNLRERRFFIFRTLSAAMIVAIGGALTWFYFLAHSYEKIAPYVSVLNQRTVVALGIVLSICLILVLFARKSRKVSIVAMGAITAPLVFVGINAAEIAEDTFSTRRIVQEIPEKIRSQAMGVYLFRDYEKLSTVPYYVGHDVPIIDSRSNDLLYGQKTDLRSDLFPSLEDFEHRVLSRKVIYVIGLENYKPEMEKLGLCQVTRHHKTVLMSTVCGKK